MSRLFGTFFVTSLGLGRSFATWTVEAAQVSAAFVLIFLQRSDTKNNVYNILWGLVFGFATLNILNLGARHFEPGKNRLSVGEIVAILVVVVSIFLLGWEMLYLFKVLPLKLR